MMLANENTVRPCRDGACPARARAPSGKSLAERLGCGYEDGDKFHPASNVAKMSAGQPLTDEDRWPWLRAIADEIEEDMPGAGEHAVIACSALIARLSRHPRAWTERCSYRLSQGHAGFDRKPSRAAEGPFHAAGSIGEPVRNPGGHLTRVKIP